MSSFKRFVEVGRVVVLSEGVEEGKLAVITEIIDQNKAVIDGPSTGVARQAIRYRQIELTPLVIKKLPRGARSATVKKQFDEAGIAQKWAESTWAKKKQSKKLKGQMSDFDRFNVMLLKKQRRRIVAGQSNKIKA